MTKNESGRISSVAVRVHRIAEAEAFYAEAFGVRFRDVDLGGLCCRFGDLGAVTSKLVPLRDASDFEGYPVHQIGAVRDPDGNTIEIYGPG
jgi:catechol 2,3-dioxygenase-like lactoylglutathione lyase family enzyme